MFYVEPLRRLLLGLIRGSLVRGSLGSLGALAHVLYRATIETAFNNAHTVQGYLKAHELTQP